MNVSDTWEEFLKLFNKKFGQQELQFPEPIAQTKEIPTTGYNELDEAMGEGMRKGKPI